MARFDVVALVLAPPEHIRAFCDHHLAQGAERIRLYLDADIPTPPVSSAVEVAVCDDAFWRAHGGRRPASIDDRQLVVYAEAYRATTADWLLVVDVDELIHGEAVVPEVLASASPAAATVIFPSAEAVYGPGDRLGEPYGQSLLRLPYGRPFSSVLPPLIYGEAGGAFTRGLLGHAMGKHAVRTGLTDILVDIHESKRDDVALPAARARDAKGRTVRLAHYDAIGLDHWRDKWDRRVQSGDTGAVGRKRQAQLRTYAESRAAGREAELFRALYALSRGQVTALRGIGRLIDNRTPSPVALPL